MMWLRYHILLLLVFQFCTIAAFTFNRYELIGYANITVKLNEPISSGPGQSLITDPQNENSKRFFGNKINRQMFDRQFALDISRSLDISSNRVYVASVEQGYVHFSWDSTSVMVHFIILDRNQTQVNSTEPTLLQAVTDLTLQAQNLTKQTPLFKGKNVTKDLDPLWGVRIDSWDTSLRLSYAIALVGGNAVIDGSLLNQGGLGSCDVAEEAVFIPKYCEFERFFEQDISRALNISINNIQILFIKAQSPDSVIVQFRLFPYTTYNNSETLTVSASELMVRLISQVYSTNSSLYNGNVTIRVDPTWGLDDQFGIPRRAGPHFAYKYYEYTTPRLSNPVTSSQITAYDRCKLNRRCNGGIAHINITTNSIQYYHQLFTDGQLFPVNLYFDFENWRIGTNPFTYDDTLYTSSHHPEVITGAHFSPFLPLYNNYSNISVSNITTNESFVSEEDFYSQSPVDLYYDTNKLYGEVLDLQAKITDLQGRISWLEENKEWYRMDSVRRSRLDVKNAGMAELALFNSRLNQLKDNLSVLSSSQCSSMNDTSGCSLLFNTSAVTMRGVINMDGRLMQTVNGTEVAVFEFHSIYLGPEVTVTVVGQRAISLLSRTSAIINTSFVIKPGTLGGFRGGGHVGVKRQDVYSDEPDPVYICDLTSSCPSNHTVSTDAGNEIIETNVNGPGSSNTRVLPFVVQTKTKQIYEVQTIHTSARAGQTLSGYFVLHYKHYSTSRIPVSASASAVRREIEDSLNRANPNSQSLNQQRRGMYNALISDEDIGVGAVWVTRSHTDDQGGYYWNITFVSSVAPVQCITVTSYLQGYEANITVTRTTAGNMLSGTFQLSVYPNIINHSLTLEWNESAADFQTKLASLPGVARALVVRTDPSAQCGDGLCASSPTNGGALIWTAYVAIYENNFPTLKTFIYHPSPTASAEHLFDDPVVATSDENDMLRVDASGLGGVQSDVMVTIGDVQSPDTLADKLLVNHTFYIAFGGSGASYGGLGGMGYAGIMPGDNYNEAWVEDLVGGSGGAMRGEDVWEFQTAYPPTGLGGAGGGAIEVVAANDITIGSYGNIDVSAAEGHGSAGVSIFLFIYICIFV